MCGVIYIVSELYLIYFQSTNIMLLVLESLQDPTPNLLEYGSRMHLDVKAMDRGNTHTDNWHTGLCIGVACVIRGCLVKLLITR